MISKYTAFLVFVLMGYTVKGQLDSINYANFIRRNTYKIIFDDGFASGFKIKGYSGIYTSLHSFLNAPFDSNFRSYSKKIKYIYNPTEETPIQNRNTFIVSKVDISRDIVYIEILNDRFLHKTSEIKYNKDTITRLDNFDKELKYCGFVDIYQRYPKIFNHPYNETIEIGGVSANLKNKEKFLELGIPDKTRQCVYYDGFMAEGFSGGPVLLNHYVIGINCFSIPLYAHHEDCISYSVLFQPDSLKSYAQLDQREKDLLSKAPKIVTDLAFFRKFKDSSEYFKNYLSTIQIKYSNYVKGLQTKIDSNNVKYQVVSLRLKNLQKKLDSLDKLLSVPVNQKVMTPLMRAHLIKIKSVCHDTLIKLKDISYKLNLTLNNLNREKDEVIQNEKDKINQVPPYIETVVRTIKMNDPEMIRINTEKPTANYQVITDDNRQFILESYKYQEYATTLYLKTMNFWIQYNIKSNNRLSLYELDSAIFYAGKLKVKLDTSVFPSALSPQEARLWAKHLHTDFKKKAGEIIQKISQECDCKKTIEEGEELERSGNIDEALKKYLVACKNACSREAFDHADHLFQLINKNYNTLMTSGKQFFQEEMYDSALVYFIHAATIKPLEELPVTMINETKQQMEERGRKDSSDLWIYSGLGNLISRMNQELILKNNFAVAVPNVISEIKRTGQYLEKIQVTFKYGHQDPELKNRIGIAYYSYNYAPGEQTSDEIERAISLINIMIRQNLLSVQDYLMPELVQLKFMGMADAIPFKSALSVKKDKNLVSIVRETVCDTLGHCDPFKKLLNSNDSFEKNKCLAFIRAYIAKQNIAYVNADLIKPENIQIFANADSSNVGGVYRGVEVRLLITLNKDLLSQGNLKKIEAEALKRQ